MRGGWVLAVAACAHAAPPAPVAAPLSAVAVIRLELDAAAGEIVDVVELGDTVVVLGAHATTVIRGGVSTRAAVPEAGWRGGAVMALGAGAESVVGLDGAGKLWRLTAGGELDEVGARLGVTPELIVAEGGGRVAFVSADGFAVLDGGVLARYPAPRFRSVTGGAGQLAGVADDGVHVMAASDVHYAVPGAALAALDEHAFAVASTSELWVAGDQAGLRRRVIPAAPIHGLAASGGRVWAAAGTALYVVDGARVARAGADVPADARLIAARAGGVWVVSGTRLARYQLDDGSAALRWRERVEPVFARACARCHLPGGSAGVDLSTFTNWNAHAAEIRRRVLDKRSMPPAGNPLSDADRAVIQAWPDGAGR